VSIVKNTRSGMRHQVKHEFFNYFLIKYSDDPLEQWKSDLTEPLQSPASSKHKGIY
jgi:hypothetical protein